MTHRHEQLDTATRDRLGKLASMPVDMSSLERRLTDALPATPKPSHPLQPSRAAGWLRVAAVIAIMLGVAGLSYVAIIGVAPQTAAAQTMTVAELHTYLLTHPDSVYRARSAAEAQQAITAQLTGQQPLPVIQDAHVESCCLVEGRVPLAGAALVVDQPAGQATIIIAQGQDFAHEMNPIAHPSGVKLQGHEHAGVPMVMRNVGDLWMCVMGDTDPSTLADIAAQIDF